MRGGAGARVRKGYSLVYGLVRQSGLSRRSHGHGGALASMCYMPGTAEILLGLGVRGQPTKATVVSHQPFCAWASARDTLCSALDVQWLAVDATLPERARRHQSVERERLPAPFPSWHATQASALVLLCGRASWPAFLDERAVDTSALSNLHVHKTMLHCPPPAPAALSPFFCPRPLPSSLHSSIAILLSTAANDRLGTASEDTAMPANALLYV
jgi:hypothetical protein